MARVHYDPIDDGLAHPWTGAVYMNPPYGRGIGAWVAKADAEISGGRARLVIGLLPARVDTRWWHAHVARHADVWLLPRRLAFGDGAAGAPFPSAVVLWGGDAGHRARLATAFPDAWHVPRETPATVADLDGASDARGGIPPHDGCLDGPHGSSDDYTRGSALPP